MLDLQPGTTLIEASAGTGKTYTLCRIALQLSLQKGIALDRILAVTFTEAATEELATRLHELYQECLHQLETGSIEESLLKDLLENPAFDAEQAIQTLRYSLEVFDEAPISTIHGFCRRALELAALETRTPLDAEIGPVENALIEQLQNEYIRQYILEPSAALAAALSQRSDYADALSDIGRQTASHPDAILRPQYPETSTDDLDRRFSQLPQLCAELLDQFPKIYQPHLSGASTLGRRKWLESASSPIAIAAKRGRLLHDDLAWLAEFAPEKWSKALKKSGQGLPTPALVNAAAAFFDQAGRALDHLAFRYRSWLAERLAQAKERANSISFNDLLHLLHRALNGDVGERVANALAARYDAALIDEFQDTDRIQFDITQRLFGNGAHYLFLIGDPKQSIYRFRGADIFAYFQATQSGSLRQISLSRNHRSGHGLVRAINALFSASKTAFVDPRILFRPVEPGARVSEPDFTPLAPLTILQMALPAGRAAPGKGEYRRILAERAANDFAQRLNSDPGLKAAQATFLVNDRIEANVLSEALQRRGISCAIRADRSIFQTQESRDVKQLLVALANPTRVSLKRGAFAALSQQWTAPRMIDDLFAEKAALFMEFIGQWARDWFGYNFNVAFNQLLSALPPFDLQDSGLDRERREAHFAQLAELLSEAKDTSGFSPRALLNWLRRQERADVSQNEDWQARISNDEGKPQILTVHKSKGLQFPIVILPFVGLRRIRAKERSIAYHDASGRMVIDFAPENGAASLDHARAEALAEDVRLLYVALTRAVHENLVYLCPEEISARSQTLTSSFAQFLLGTDAPASTAPVAEALQALAANSDGEIDFRPIAMEAEPFTRYQNSDTRQATEVYPRALANRAALPGPERVLSFSALSRTLHASGANDIAVGELEEAKAAQDESPAALPAALAEEPEATDPTILSIFTLPKGTRAGDLLHLILERFQFDQPETLARATQEAFDELKFEPRDFEPIVAAQIAAIAKAELPSHFGPFRLEQVPAEQRVAELEFSYPVVGDARLAIARALRTAPTGRIPLDWIERFAGSESRLRASMLRGFIDLVFEFEGRLYILDWKSNYLGDRPDLYDARAMELAMSEHDYYLQYLLYCVALKRHVAWRYPDSSFADRFGGVFYIFARGVSPGKQSGFYYDYPSAALLDQLDDALSGKEFSQ